MKFLFLVGVFSAVISANRMALADRGPIHEIDCKTSRDERLALFADAKLGAGIAWLDEAGELQNISGELVHEELYKAFVLYFEGGRFVIEDNIFNEVGTKQYAKLSLPTRSLNYICHVTNIY